ncbi:hypothetical protein D3C80_1355570 [compost metagenome]
MRALDVQGIQQGQHIAPQLFDAVGARSDQRTAMAACVETQHPKVFGKRGNLRVPHVQVGAQGVGQHQYRRMLWTVELVVQFAIGEWYKCHGNSPSDSQCQMFGQRTLDPGFRLAEVMRRVH